MIQREQRVPRPREQKTAVCVEKAFQCGQSSACVWQGAE